MTYPRFAQLWRALVTDRTFPPRAKDAPPVAHLPASPHLVDALVELAETGQSKAFDEAERILKERDSQP